MTMFERGWALYNVGCHPVTDFKHEEVKSLLTFLVKKEAFERRNCESGLGPSKIKKEIYLEENH